MARSDAAGTPAIRALTAAGVPHTVHAYTHSTSGLGYGAEAAQALGVSPDQLFKTLVTQVDGRLTMAVVPVAGRLDLKALAEACHAKKAAMAELPDAERATGYVAGGISPFGGRTTLPVVIDETVWLHDTVYVSAGRRGLDVALHPDDLVRLTGAVVAAIARD